MSIHFRHTDKQLSVTLTEVAAGLPPEGLTITQLLERIGEQGLLLLCMVLALPFLFPIPIPGVSVPFGALVMMIGIGVATDSVPWLPRRLMERRIAAAHLSKVLTRAARAFARLERAVRPRLLALTTGPVMNALNGAILVLCGGLLMVPLPPIALFTNALPAAGIILTAAGLLQRDGYCLVAGYIVALATAGYFAAIGVAIYWMGNKAIGWLTPW